MLLHQTVSQGGAKAVGQVTGFHSNYSPEVVLGDKVRLLLFLWHPSPVFLPAGEAHLFL